MKLTRNDIFYIFKKIKYLAQKDYNDGNFEKSLKTISTAARVAYLFNFIYKDDDLEQLILSISQKLINREKIAPQHNKFVMIDSFGAPKKGLTQQYLRALLSMNVDFLYISIYFSEKNSEIYSEVENSSKGSLCIVPSGSTISKIQYIYNQIVIFKPESIIAHIFPWDTIATAVLYSLTEIKKYNINLTDHAFWLGSNCFNYSFEFRAFGCNVSFDKRGLSGKQLLLNPFYPIVDKSVFMGFPPECKGKVVLFSGGDYNKVYGNNNKFLYILKKILDINDDAVLLFAGTGFNKKPFQKFVRKFNLQKRLILIGERKDINEVFSHCDIYMGTYPIPGGLMTQYAAYHSKPIVAFADSNSNSQQVEDLLFQNELHSIKITYTIEDEYLNEVNRLIKDISYRNEKGQQLQQSLTTKDQFEYHTRVFFRENKAIDYNKIEIEYDIIFDQYLELNNNKSFDLGIELYKNYKLNALFLFPKAVIKFFFKITQFYIQTRFLSRFKRKFANNND